MAKVVVLNTDQAYVSDITSITDVLTAGLYIKEAPMIVTGFDSAVHTLSLVTSAADVKILDIVYSKGGYAIWKVYKVVEIEVSWGYVVITITATGTVASIDAANALGAAEITNAELAEILIASAPAAQYTDPDDISAAITAVKALMRITAE